MMPKLEGRYERKSRLFRGYCPEAVLVMAVAYFACVYLGRSIKLEILVQHIQRAAKRIYGIAEFRFYAVADGIKQVLFSSRSGIGKPPPPVVPSQLTLPNLTL